LSELPLLNFTEDEEL